MFMQRPLLSKEKESMQQTLSEWKNQGGVMICGFQLFAKLASDLKSVCPVLVINP